MAIMHRIAATILGAALLTTTAASAEVAQVQLGYDTYAAGIEVMQMRAFFGLGPWNYHIDVNYHTTGLVGVFYSGRQTNTARGAGRMIRQCRWNSSARASGAGMHAAP